MGLLSNSMVNVIGILPEPVIWRFARRYIAGSNLESGLAVREHLFQSGILNTMDILGEDVLSVSQADVSFKDYLALIKGMADSGVPGNISLKLSQLGLKIDPEYTRKQVLRLAAESETNGFFFRLDMEDSSTTTFTLDLYRELRKKNPQTGAVIQAYLKRSVNDVRTLLSEGQTNIRICKGIYKESPEIALKDRLAIRDNFLLILRLILDAGAYPAIATHDPFLIEQSMREIAKRKISTENYEFQMLHGVGFKWRKVLLEKGHRLRIYIPFGDAWRAYSLRRFRENPTIAFYIFKNLVSAN